MAALGLVTALGVVISCGGSPESALSNNADSGQQAPITPEELEAEAQAINKLLMCRQCSGQTIDQSGVELARQMRQVVKDKLADGWTRSEILDYFSDPERYGPAVLASPPKEGFSLLVWTLPPGALVGGALLLYYVLKAMGHRHQVPQEVETEGLEAYLDRVDSDLGIGKGQTLAQRNSSALSPNPERKGPKGQ